MTEFSPPIAVLDPDDIDGNALSTVVAVTRAMRIRKMPADVIADFQQEALSADYDHVLRTAARWVDVRSGLGRPASHRASKSGARHARGTVGQRDGSTGSKPHYDEDDILEAYARASGL